MVRLANRGRVVGDRGEARGIVIGVLGMGWLITNNQGSFGGMEVLVGTPE